MENYKIKVNNEAESKEAQELFFELGCYWSGGKNKDTVIKVTNGRYIFSRCGEMTYCDSSEVELNGVGFSLKEITLQQLKDLVVLKRNSVDDASFKDSFGDIWYVDSTNSYWMFENGIWREAEEPLFKLELIEKPINKEGEVKMKKKEYIANVSGDWRLVESHELVSGRIEVPEGAEIFLLDKSWSEDILYFVKHDGDVFHEYYIDATDIQNNTWIKGTIKELHKDMGEVLWERKSTTPNTSTQEKLKFIEKWLNGEKIQYILGVESEKSQVDESKWHNFTEGAMQYIKRSDIKFREAPKYVTINGIEFKSVESLLKHVKNNFDLEDGD